jgi:hypothetical protein
VKGVGSEKPVHMPAIRLAESTHGTTIISRITKYLVKIIDFQHATCYQLYQILNALEVSEWTGILYESKMSEIANDRTTGKERRWNLDFA